jgi:hypothetical protein
MSHGSHKQYHARRAQFAVWRTDGSSITALQLHREVTDISSFFDWGRNSPGTAQLAVAILADLTDEDFARAHYVRFAREFLAGAPHERWSLSGDKIAEWCKCRAAVCV